MIAGNKRVNNFSTWWLMLIAGVILIFIGISALLEPWNTFIYLIKYTGIALILSSVFLLIHALAIKSIAGEAKWLVIESMIDLVFASVLIFNPFLAAIAFPILIGCWILFRGILKILVSLLLSRFLNGWLYILGVGILSLVFGLLIIFFPFERGKGIGFAMSIFSLLIGTLYIYDAFRFRKMEDTLIAWYNSDMWAQYFIYKGR